MLIDLVIRNLGVFILRESIGISLVGVVLIFTRLFTLGGSLWVNLLRKEFISFGTGLYFFNNNRVCSFIKDVI